MLDLAPPSDLFPGLTDYCRRTATRSTGQARVTHRGSPFSDYHELSYECPDHIVEHAHRSRLLTGLAGEGFFQFQEKCTTISRR